MSLLYELNDIPGEGNIYFDRSTGIPINDLSSVYFLDEFNNKHLVWEKNITVILPSGQNFDGTNNTTLYPRVGFDVWTYVKSQNVQDAKIINIIVPSGADIGPINFEGIPFNYTVSFINYGYIKGYNNTDAVTISSPITFFNNGYIYAGGTNGGSGGKGGNTTANISNGTRVAFTSPGTYRVPSNVYKVKYGMVGAGGGGSTTQHLEGGTWGDLYLWPGGGYAGQYKTGTANVTPGGAYSVTVPRITSVRNSPQWPGYDLWKEGWAVNGYAGSYSQVFGVRANGGAGGRWNATNSGVKRTWGYDGQASQYGTGGIGATRLCDGCRAGNGGYGAGGGGSSSRVGEWQMGGNGGNGLVYLTPQYNIPSVSGGAGGAGGAGEGWNTLITQGLPGSSGISNVSNTAISGAGGQGGTGGTWGEIGSGGFNGKISSDGNSGSTGLVNTYRYYAIRGFSTYTKTGSTQGITKGRII